MRFSKRLVIYINDQQFSRSCVGGNTVPTEFPTDLDENESKDVETSNNVFLLTKVTDTNTDLHFESRFESGNLCKVVKITDTYYQLYLRKDLYTQRHTQWYYFRISNTRSRTNYRWIPFFKSHLNFLLRGLIYKSIKLRKFQIVHRES